MHIIDLYYLEQELEHRKHSVFVEESIKIHYKFSNKAINQEYLLSAFHVIDSF